MSFRCMQSGLAHLFYFVAFLKSFLFSSLFFFSEDGQRRDYNLLDQKLSAQKSQAVFFNLSLLLRKCHDAQLCWPCCPRTHFSKEDRQSSGAGAPPGRLSGRYPHGKEPMPHSSAWRGTKNHCTMVSVFSFCKSKTAPCVSTTGTSLWSWDTAGQ